MSLDLKQTIKDKARQLGFSLAGVTLPEPPPHYSTFENWLAQGRHGTMEYLAADRSGLDVEFQFTAGHGICGASRGNGGEPGEDA